MVGFIAVLKNLAGINSNESDELLSLGYYLLISDMIDITKVFYISIIPESKNLYDRDKSLSDSAELMLAKFLSVVPEFMRTAVI